MADTECVKQEARSSLATQGLRLGCKQLFPNRGKNKSLVVGFSLGKQLHYKKLALLCGLLFPIKHILQI